MTQAGSPLGTPRMADLTSARRQGITHLEVSGFKSIAEPQGIEIRPLTILAGPNSSGKSSMIQPLLLFKQTLEASFDPGAVLLNGDNIKFTSSDQVFSKAWSTSKGDDFTLRLVAGPLTLGFRFARRKRIDITEMWWKGAGTEGRLAAGMSSADIRDWLGGDSRYLQFPADGDAQPELAVVRDRCFLTVADARRRLSHLRPLPQTLITDYFERAIREVIHLPGLRGNPERTYPTTAVGQTFPGTFENYTASVIARWQDDHAEKSLAALRHDLEILGLTWKVTADGRQLDWPVTTIRMAGRGPVRRSVRSPLDLRFGGCCCG